MNHSFNIKIAKRFGQEGAVIIENIYFWLEKNKANNKHFHDGKYWTYNSTRAFAVLFPYWTSRQIERILKGLESNGAILAGNYNKIGYDRTKWYSITSMVESIYTYGGMDVTEGVNGNTPIVEPIPVINPIINSVINKKPKEMKINYADNVKMLEVEYTKLITQYTKVVIDEKIIDLSLWKGSKGKKTKSDYLTLLTWLRKDTKSNTPTKEDTWGGMKQFN